MYGAFCDWSDDALELSYTELQHTEEMRRRARMHRVLKRLYVPVTALKGLEFTPGFGNPTGTIRFLPRPGASPFHQAAGGDLHPSGDPLAFAFPAEKELLTEYYATEITRAISAHGMADTPADRFLISSPSCHSRLVAFDGTVEWKKEGLHFTWGLEANPMKRRRKQQSTVPINKLQSVTWTDWRHDPDKIGYLRFQVIGNRRAKHQTVDPTTVILDTEERFAEGLVFAAAVLDRMQLKKKPPLRPRSTAALPVLSRETTQLLRELGDLRDAGILTEEEFQAKKRQLLGRI